MNNRGFAVVTAVILTGVVVLLISVVLYIYNTSTRSVVLGVRKTLDDTLSMSAYKTVVKRIDDDHYYYKNNQTSKESNKCFLVKVLYPTDEWTSQALWQNNDCPSLSDATSEDIDGIENYPDFHYTTSEGDEVYVKLVYSSTGNTTIGSSHALNVSGVTALPGGVQTVKPPSLPHVYKIDIVVKDKLGSTVSYVGVYLY